MSTSPVQAVWAPAQGAPLEVGPIEKPAAHAGEIVVRTHALAINPVDWLMRDTGLFVQRWPTVLGVDIAGEVVELGPGVTRFKVGDRVLSHVLGTHTGDSRNGAFQHYVAAPEHHTANIPSHIAYTEAVVLPLAVSTASAGLYRSRSDNFLGLPIPSLDSQPLNKTLLVWGGSSSVGATAIQLAVASGATVIAVAGPSNHAFVRSLGATTVLDHHADDIVAQAVAAIKATNQSFLGIYDAISKEASLKHTLRIAAEFDDANIAIVLPKPEGVDVPENVKLGSVYAVDEVTKPIWAEFVGPALAQNVLKPVPEPLIVGKGLESVQKGLEENKKGVSGRKVVVEL